MRFRSVAQRKAVMASLRRQVFKHSVAAKGWAVVSDVAGLLPAVSRQKVLQTGLQMVKRPVTVIRHGTRQASGGTGPFASLNPYKKAMPFRLGLGHPTYEIPGGGGVIGIPWRTSSPSIAHELGHLRPNRPIYTQSISGPKLLHEELAASRFGAQVYKKAGGSSTRYWAELGPSFKAHRAIERRNAARGIRYQAQFYGPKRKIDTSHARAMGIRLR